MNSKEKAKELIRLFLPNAESVYRGTYDEEVGIGNAKKCATTCVDEILGNCCGQYSDGDIYQDDLFANADYWEEVKKELETL